MYFAWKFVLQQSRLTISPFFNERNFGNFFFDQHKTKKYLFNRKDLRLDNSMLSLNVKNYILYLILYVNYILYSLITSWHQFTNVISIAWYRHEMSMSTSTSIPPVSSYLGHSIVMSTICKLFSPQEINTHCVKCDCNISAFLSACKGQQWFTKCFLFADRPIDWPIRERWMSSQLLGIP